MNQPVRYVAMVFATIDLHRGGVCAGHTPLPTLHRGKIGVSLMSANDIANTSSVASLTKNRFSRHRRAGRGSDRLQLAQTRSFSPY